MKRTDKQRKALHKWFALLAYEMKERGLDMRKILKPSIEITPTPYLVKEYLWKSTQKIMTGKHSTIEITTKELQEIYNVLDTHLLKENKIDLPFPSEDNLHQIENLIKEYNL